MATFDAAAAQYKSQLENDSLSNYDPRYTSEQWIEEQTKLAEKKFNALAKEVHLPFLDVKLFRKYFLTSQQNSKSEQNLSNLLCIIGILADHKNVTISLLKLIFEREQIMSVIKVLTTDYSKGKVSTLEVQTKVLQLLCALQRVTLQIVEGITVWRSRLTRRYAFEWRGINYIFKIIKDCQFIDACDLNAVLPLQLSTYPLCSNLRTLNIFGPQLVATSSVAAVMNNSNSSGGASSPTMSNAAIAITYPMKASKKNSASPPITAEFQSRLQQAELIIASEHTLQVNLLQELQALNAAGAFLTVMDVRMVVPNCCDGIRLNNKAWDERLQQAISSSIEKLQKVEKFMTTTTASPHTKQQQRQADGGYTASPIGKDPQTHNNGNSDESKMKNSQEEQRRGDSPVVVVDSNKKSIPMKEEKREKNQVKS